MGELDRVEIFRSKRLLDLGLQWRWRYVREGNNKRMANGGESFENLEDCVISAGRVVGFDVHSEENWDLVETRPDGTEIFIVERAGGNKIEIRRTP